MALGIIPVPPCHTEQCDLGQVSSFKNVHSQTHNVVAKTERVLAFKAMFTCIHNEGLGDKAADTPRPATQPLPRCQNPRECILLIQEVMRCHLGTESCLVDWNLHTHMREFGTGGRGDRKAWKSQD